MSLARGTLGEHLAADAHLECSKGVGAGGNTQTDGKPLLPSTPIQRAMGRTRVRDRASTATTSRCAVSETPDLGRGNRTTVDAITRRLGDPTDSHENTRGRSQGLHNEHVSSSSALPRPRVLRIIIGTSVMIPCDTLKVTSSRLLLMTSNEWLVHL